MKTKKYKCNRKGMYNQKSSNISSYKNQIPQILQYGLLIWWSAVISSQTCAIDNTLPKSNKKTTERFGRKFSYCLVDHLSSNNISSYLIFGLHEESDIMLEIQQNIIHKASPRSDHSILCCNYQRHLNWGHDVGNSN